MVQDRDACWRLTIAVDNITPLINIDEIQYPD
jgi:hypothetical protein